MPFMGGDDAAWERLARGDGGALAALVERYEVPLLRYLARLVGSTVAAEELLARTFEAVHATRGRGPAGLSRRARLFAAARELGAAYLACSGPRDVPPVATGSPSLGRGGADGRAPGVERAVRRAFAGLPLSVREALCLKLYGELPAREIAEILAIDRDRAMAWIERGLRGIASHLAPVLDAEGAGREER